MKCPELRILRVPTRTDDFSTVYPFFDEFRNVEIEFPGVFLNMVSFARTYIFDFSGQVIRDWKQKTSGIPRTTHELTPYE